MGKRPRDPAQLAKAVFDIAIGEAEDTVSHLKRHPTKRAAGGLHRAASLSQAKRKAIARAAAKARWNKR